MDLTTRYKHGFQCLSFIKCLKDNQSMVLKKFWARNVGEIQEPRAGSNRYGTNKASSLEYHPSVYY